MDKTREGSGRGQELQINQTQLQQREVELHFYLPDPVHWDQNEACQETKH